MVINLKLFFLKNNNPLFSIRYDEFLQWDPDDFNGIRRLNLPSKLIWLPDIVLYNVRLNKKILFQIF
jgi:hypothetical protein